MITAEAEFFHYPDEETFKWEFENLSNEGFKEMLKELAPILKKYQDPLETP